MRFRLSHRFMEAKAWTVFSGALGGWKAVALLTQSVNTFDGK